MAQVGGSDRVVGPGGAICLILDSAGLIMMLPLLPLWAASSWPADSAEVGVGVGVGRGP